MLPEWTAVGFTGHRNIADPAAVSRRIGAALDDLASACGPLVAVSSLAKGCDTLFVQEALNRNIPIFLILPFPKARFQRDFTTEDWLAVVPLLERAAHVEEVQLTQSDEESYMEAGVRTVDQAHVLLAVWDGKATAGLGGTGDVVAYARAMARPLVWVNPAESKNVTERLEELPPNAPFPQPGADPRTIVEQHFRELDEAATRRAPTVRNFIQRVVLLHLAAAVAGLTTLALDIHGMLEYASAALEIAVLGIAFSLIASRHHHGHMAWMQTRIEAEICRSFLATWQMRARLDPFPRLMTGGYRRLARTLRLIQLLDTTPAPPLEVVCRDYLDSRVRSQISYYSRGGDQAKRAYSQLRLMAMISTALAALLATSHVALSLLHATGPALTVTKLLSLVLPLVSAALLALVLTQEHSRRATRYAEMVATLEVAGQELRAVRTWNGLARIAVDTEEALLNEAIEWQSFRRFATEPH